MQSFEFASPSTPEQAVQLLSTGPGNSAAVLAGGSDLLGLMKDGIETPRRLVSLRAVQGLRGIRREPSGAFRIGALTTIDELSADAVLRKEHPILATAAEHVAGPQIRNVATLGGNLCQRPRCWYFRNGFGLLALKDGKSMVVDGDNRYHAIFGNGAPAYFVTPSTLAPLLIALGGELTLVGAQGPKKMPLDRFFRIPARESEREHLLAPGEVVTEVLVPAAAGRRIASYEVRQRQSLDWSLATASVALEMDGSRVRRARLILGQVAPIPWQAKEAEAFLKGKTIDEAVAAKAGEAAVQDAKPLSRNRYKIQLARTAVKRALLAAAGREA
jgi:xanthine dehydrogenase YagS FAD-binding subunit